MNNTIRDLLYDYIKGLCSDAQKLQVEQELARSQELREELTRVKRYYDSVAMVDSERVSQQFLTEIHKRIEKTQKKTLLEQLFFPLHVKLPAELIGVACTVLLVVYYFVPQLVTKERAVAGYETTYSEIKSESRAQSMKSSEVSGGSVNPEPKVVPLSSKPAKTEKKDLGVQKQIIRKVALPEKNAPVPLQKSNAVAVHDAILDKSADKEIFMSAPAPAAVAPAAPISALPMPEELSGAIQSSFADAKTEPVPIQDNAAPVYEAKLSRESRSNTLQRNEEIEGIAQTVKWTMMIGSNNNKADHSQLLSKRKMTAGVPSGNAGVSMSAEKEAADDETLIADDATVTFDQPLKVKSIIGIYCSGSVVIDSTNDSYIFSAHVPAGKLQKLFSELSSVGNITGKIPVTAENKGDNVSVMLTIPKM